MSQAEFETRLRALVAEADSGNARLTGAYSVRSPDPEVQDYDVQITEVTDRHGIRPIDVPEE